MISAVQYSNPNFGQPDQFVLKLNLDEFLEAEISIVIRENLDGSPVGIEMSGEILQKTLKKLERISRELS